MAAGALAGVIITGLTSLAFYPKPQPHTTEIIGSETVLSPIPPPEPTPTITLEPTVTPTVKPTIKPTPKPTATPTAIPEPTKTPTPTFSPQSLWELFEKYASRYSVPSSQLNTIAWCESKHNPNATNYIYAGLYQFSPATWKSNRLLMGENPDPELRFHPEEAIKTAAFLLSTRGVGAWPNCK
jgi:hypothetical protein